MAHISVIGSGNVGQIIAQHGAQSACGVAVDIPNPLTFEAFDSLTVPAASAAAEIATTLRAVDTDGLTRGRCGHPHPHPSVMPPEQ